MRAKNALKIFLFVAIATIFACSSSEDNGDGGGNGGGNNGPTSLTVTASSLFVDFGTEVTFTVKTNEGTNVTTEAIISVNGAPISGNTHTSPSTGEYTVSATYETLTSSTITVNVIPILESISIETASAVYNIGERVEYVVVGTDNDGGTTTLTSASTVFVDNAESATGNVIIPGVTGTIEAYATFNEFTSDAITITIEDNASTPASYTRKALVEDYTGDWCGYCTRVAHAIDLVEAETDNAVIVATHVYNGDPYQNSFGIQLANAFNVTGLPTAYVNRASEWSFPEPDNVNQVTNLATGTRTSGISINSAIKGDNLSFIVNAGFGQATNGAKIVVYLLENGLTTAQTNYYPEYYGGDNPIPDFVHNHVLRHSFTNVLGDAIPAGETAGNNTYNLKYDYVIPSTLFENAANVEIVAMLVDASNQIINVNVVHAGSAVEFN